MRQHIKNNHVPGVLSKSLEIHVVKGYEKALDSQAKGQIKILSHAKVRNGDLLYDRSEQIR